MEIRGNRMLRPAAIVLSLLIGVLVTPASARAPELAMLQGLSAGLWDIRIHGEGSHSKICVRTGHELIQIRHRQAVCSRTVIEDRPNLVSVEYTCPRGGYGRTSIRRENAQLVQIDSQGIQGGLPFHFKAEARRVGGC